ncbi:MAG: glycosyltransferase family 39 protein [Chloroflexi bacterium]|nr:glycosyltransferase family 39 protein [Chloroflexota bacterium]
MKQLSSRRFWLDLFLVGVIALAMAIPRLTALGRFVTADEGTWGKRAASFYYALADGDYAATYLTGHPGVTTMWAGAAAYALKFPRFQKIGQVSLGDTRLLDIFHNQQVSSIELLATGRSFMAAANILVLLIALLFARRLLGRSAAYLGFLLIAWDAFQIAHARVLHTNGLLASLMALSILAFMDYLSRRKAYALAVSGLAAGLSFATLSPGFMLMPAVGLLTLLDFVRRREDWRQVWGEAALPLLGWGALAALAVYLVWPAMWAAPLDTLRQMLGYGFSAAEGEIGGPMLVEYFDSGGPKAGYFYFYPLAYLWRTSPVVLIGLALAAAALYARLGSAAGQLASRAQRAAAGALLLYAVVYLVLMSLGAKKFDRYLLPAYPALDLAAGYGWVALASWLAGKLPRLRRAGAFAAVTLLAAGWQLIGPLNTYPYYFTYYNPLMGGPAKADSAMMVGWGEGLNEAALYLKEIPEIEKKRVISWYTLAFSWYSLPHGFRSEMVEFAPSDSLERFADYDYAVIYINQRQRDIPAALLDALETQQPLYTVKLEGVEYAWVYSLDFIR